MSEAEKLEITRYELRQSVTSESIRAYVLEVNQANRLGRVILEVQESLEDQDTRPQFVDRRCQSRTLSPTDDLVQCDLDSHHAGQWHEGWTQDHGKQTWKETERD